MELANEKMRARIQNAMEAAIAYEGTPAEYKEAFTAWIENQNDADKTKELAALIIPMVEAAKDKCPNCATIAELSHFLVKRSQWIIGGDGASYDIGYGGLDHVIASGKNVNILVLDTEVYSNTGGQSSKAPPVGAIVKFAAAGKRVRKKDLGLMATTYGYVSMRELLARVKANIRRTEVLLHEAAREPRTNGGANQIVQGRIRIDTEEMVGYKDNVPLDLTQREYELLKFLASQPGKVFSREALMEHVWNYEGYVGDVRAVDVAVRRLREKVEDDPASPQFILTRRGLGYLFHGEAQ